MKIKFDPGDVRPWKKGDADSRCQRCGQLYAPWFTDNWLWNEVRGGGGDAADPGGFLCPTCFAKDAELHYGRSLIWRFTPEWSGRAPLMDFPKDD